MRYNSIYLQVKPQQQSASNSAVAVNSCGSPGPGSNSVLGMASSVGPMGSASPPLAAASIGLNTTSNNIYQTLTGTAAFGGIGGAIPSPPILFNSTQQVAAAQNAGLYQPFLEQRTPSQYSQYPPYGLGQSLGNNAFGQQSMFLQTPPLTAPTDIYTNNISPYRLQPAAVAGFGQTQPQNQNTVLISSANSTLMSSAVKPSSQTFGGNSQQNFGTIGSKAGTPFQQSGLGNALQGAPQGPLYIYDSVQPIGLISSQLMQRPPVQGSVLQTIQTPNSFYSNNGGGGGSAAAPSAAPTQQAAAGFYPGSTLQQAAAVVQQQQNPPTAFGLQGFANQSQPVAAAATAVGLQNYGSGLGLTAQQLNAVAASYQRSAGSGSASALATNMFKSLQQGAAVQGTGSPMPDPSRQQMKSPNPVMGNTFATTYFSGQSSECCE